MTRKASFACKNELHKCNKASNYLPKSDRISELPDEVVISILSCLGLKEAAKTSVLSHRWEKLWTLTTGILEFDGTETLKDMEWQKLEYERVKFSDWVNQVLKLHQGHSINEFRILFDFDSGSSHDINNWIGYALQKGVKRLELDLRRWVRCDSNEKFSFPGIEKLTFFAKQKVDSSFILHFHPLTAIILKDVNISQEVLDYFFLNCPFLERLSVMGSKGVVYLKASGALLKLKYLEISNCSEITNIEIYADNLVSFMYSGPKITFKINSAPRLSELSLGDECSGHFIEQLWGHVGFLYRFKTLSVKLNLGVEAPVHYPKFNNLIQLEIDMFTRDYETLLWITSFIGSCPSLRKFTIDLAYYDVSRSKLSARLLRETLRNEAHARQARKCRHENLKEVELRGFCGRRSYVELALSLLRTAVSLEKIIIDTRLQVWQHENLPCEFVESHDRTQAYRKSAMKLKKKVPAGVRFVVL